MVNDGLQVHGGLIDRANLADLAQKKLTIVSKRQCPYQAGMVSILWGAIF